MTPANFSDIVAKRIRDDFFSGTEWEAKDPKYDDHADLMTKLFHRHIYDRIKKIIDEELAK